jgi:hypothetical protein
MLNWFAKRKEAKHKREEAAMSYAQGQEAAAIASAEIHRWLAYRCEALRPKMEEVYHSLIEKEFDDYEPSGEENAPSLAQSCAVQALVFEAEMAKLVNRMVHDEFPIGAPNAYEFFEALGTISGEHKSILDGYTEQIRERLDEWMLDILLEANAWGQERVASLSPTAREEFRSWFAPQLTELVSRVTMREIEQGVNPFDQANAKHRFAGLFKPDSTTGAAD